MQAPYRVADDDTFVIDDFPIGLLYINPMMINSREIGAGRRQRAG